MSLWSEDRLIETLYCIPYETNQVGNYILDQYNLGGLIGKKRQPIITLDAKQ